MHIEARSTLVLISQAEQSNTVFAAENAGAGEAEGSKGRRRRWALGRPTG
jgi:hypothetical protein